MYYVNKMFDFLFPKVPQVEAELVKQAMDKKDNFILLDVRTPQEYAKGHLSKSINVPLDMVKSTIEGKIKDKTKTVYVYCLSGSRSVHAVNMMVELGFTKVFDMKSGLLAWRAKGYTV